MNHVHHGWLLLQVKCPELRAISALSNEVRDLCEDYSLVVTYLDKLQRTNASPLVMAEYEEMSQIIESEVTARVGLPRKRSPLRVTSLRSSSAIARSIIRLFTRFRRRRKLDPPTLTKRLSG